MFTRNGKIQATLRLKNNAIGIFTSAREKLLEVHERLDAHINEAKTNIDLKQKEIDDEKDLIAQHLSHRESTRNTINKIDELLK